MLVQDSVDKQYGSSTTLCDYILVHQLEEIQPRQVVDFGAGGGKNGKLARQVLAEQVTLTAVEGCEKTAQMLSTQSLYDRVFCALIQDWVLTDSNQYDLAIVGDVLEHLKPREIHAFIGPCTKKFKHIIVVCPLYDIFQDDDYGNPLEIHQTYITEGFFDRYNIKEKHIIKTSEWTMMSLRIESACESQPIWRRFSWFVFHGAMLILQPLGLAKPFVRVLKRYALKYKWLLRR